VRERARHQRKRKKKQTNYNYYIKHGTSKIMKGTKHLSALLFGEKKLEKKKRKIISL
jgi:hypothetical protein